MVRLHIFHIFVAYNFFNLDHLEWLLKETGETLYWRDMQGIESCHARMTEHERAHNTKATYCKVRYERILVSSWHLIPSKSRNQKM